MWDHWHDEAEHWRIRAEQARAMVANLTSEESRRLMVRAAASYDKLAVKAEREQKL